MKFKNFIDWLVGGESWKGLSALVYLTICLVDFVILPALVGMTRPTPVEVFLMTEEIGVEITLQVVQFLSQPHQPLTLQGGGMFHIAFGAILTGAAVVNHRNGYNNTQVKTS